MKDWDPGDDWSTRRLIMERLRWAASAIRGGSYMAVRGPVNWAAWDFERWPLGIAIFKSAGALLPNESTDDLAPAGMRWMDVTLEFCARLQFGDTGLPALNEGVLDWMDEDATVLALDLSKLAAESLGDPEFRLVGSGTEAVEWSDVQKQLQGIVATFRIVFASRRNSR